MKVNKKIINNSRKNIFKKLIQLKILKNNKIMEREVNLSKNRLQFQYQQTKHLPKAQTILLLQHQIQNNNQ